MSLRKIQQVRYRCHCRCAGIDAAKHAIESRIGKFYAALEIE